MKAILDPFDEVTFDVEGFGSGRGQIAGMYVHTDGTRLYAVYPKHPRPKDHPYQYVCIIIPEDKLISTPF